MANQQYKEHLAQCALRITFFQLSNFVVFQLSV